MTKAFQNAGAVISAWDGRKLIGLAGVLDDGELTAYIHYLLIRPEYQRRGIGRRHRESGAFNNQHDCSMYCMDALDGT